MPSKSVKSIWSWNERREKLKTKNCRISNNLQGERPDRHSSLSGSLPRICDETSTFWRTNATVCMKLIHQTYFLTCRELAYLYFKEVNNDEWCARFQLLLLLLRCLLWSGPNVTMRLWATAPPTVSLVNWGDRVISLPHVWLLWKCLIIYTK